MSADNVGPCVAGLTLTSAKVNTEMTELTCCKDNTTQQRTTTVSSLSKDQLTSYVQIFITRGTRRHTGYNHRLRNTTSCAYYDQSQTTNPAYLSTLIARGILPVFPLPPSLPFPSPIPSTGQLQGLEEHRKQRSRIREQAPKLTMNLDILNTNLSIKI